MIGEDEGEVFGAALRGTYRGIAPKPQATAKHQREHEEYANKENLDRRPQAIRVHDG
jgi:hypothetical protein